MNSTRHSLAEYLVDKYTRYLTNNPEYAAQLHQFAANQLPNKYRVNAEGDLCVDTEAIRTWALTAELTQAQIDYHSDKLVDPALYDKIVTTAAYGSLQDKPIVDDTNNPFTYTLSTLEPIASAHLTRDWEEFVPTFMGCRLWSQPLVQYAHWRARCVSEQDTLVGIPPNVMEAIIKAVTDVLPASTRFGSLYAPGSDLATAPVLAHPYPLNHLLNQWLRAQEGEHHREVIELAVLLWRAATQKVHASDIHQHLEYAWHCAYTAYNAYSQELLRVYPHLILILTSIDTLDQIQMECELIAQALHQGWQYQLHSTDAHVTDILLQYQDRFEPNYSPINNLLVSPSMLEAAGVGVADLVRSSQLKLLINTADHPTLHREVIMGMPSYKLFGMTYSQGHVKRLLTHTDQLQYQHLRPGVQGAYEEDADDYYPSHDDVYEQFYQRALPVRTTILGEKTMNPQYHHAYSAYSSNAAMAPNLAPSGYPGFQQPQPAMMDAPVHARWLYQVPQLFAPNAPNPVNLATPDLLKWQSANAPQGVYLRANVGQPQAVVVKEIIATPNGPCAVVCFVNPLADEQMSDRRTPMPRQEIPPQFLPGIQANALRSQLQQMNAPMNNMGMLPGMPSVAHAGAQMSPLFTQAMQNSNSFTPAPTEPRANSMEELRHMPAGAVYIDGETKYTRTSRAVPWYTTETVSKTANPALLRPPVNVAAAPVQAAPPAPAPTVPHSAVQAILQKEFERTGEQDPVVATVGVMQDKLRLSDVLTNPDYLDAHGLSWLARVRTPAYAAHTGYLSEIKQAMKEASAAPAVPMRMAAPATPVLQQPLTPAPRVSTDDLVSQILSKSRTANPVSVSAPEEDFEALDDESDDFTQQLQADLVDELATAPSTPMPAQDVDATAADVMGQLNITGMDPVESDTQVVYEDYYAQSTAEPVMRCMPAISRKSKITLTRAQGNLSIRVNARAPLSDVTYSPANGGFTIGDDAVGEYLAVLQDPLPQEPQVNISLAVSNSEGHPVTDDDIVEALDAQVQALAQTGALVLGEITLPESAKDCTLIPSYTLTLTVPAQGVNTVQAALCQLARQAHTGDEVTFVTAANFVLNTPVTWDRTNDLEGMPRTFNEFHDYAQDLITQAGESAQAGAFAEQRRMLGCVNRTLTKEINKALKEILGLKHTVLSYLAEHRELSKRLSASPHSGTATVWEILERSIVEGVLGQLTWQPCAQGGYYLTTRQAAYVIHLGVMADDLDMQLDATGLARSVPEQRNALTHALMERLEHLCGDYHTLSVSDTPYKLLEIYIGTLDGVLIKATRYPLGITDNNDAPVWMLSLQ